MSDTGKELALIGLQPEALQAVFPFHFVFDRELHVVQTAPSLLKLIPEVVTGVKVTDYFRIATPSVPLEFDAIAGQAFTVYFIESLDKRFKLKGQMLPRHENGQDLMMFLGSPVVREMSSVSGLGLTLKDFAIHDSVIDFLILLQTKTNTINDVKSMADRLKKEVGERREAQKELQQINEQLEERVRDRTRALEMANGQLSGMVSRLEEHNRQMVLLNAMGDMLQACRSLRETYSVIANSLQGLLPGESGYLAFLEADQRYHIVAVWGGYPIGDDASFSPDDCWGLRRARIHEHETGDSEAVCAHVRAYCINQGVRHACIPLATQGEQHGLLHLHGLPVAHEGNSAELENDRRQLLHTAAEHISLAIANLKLQEYLRQQSIRDALTGLYNRRHMEDSLHREIARADRSGKPCSVIMLDVDHFKKFNDNYGHQAGDALLQGLGKFLSGHVRGEDIPCRYGGEEFILILPGAPAEGAAMRAEQIRASVEASLKVSYEEGFLPQVTISLGVAAYPTHARDAADAVKAADAALYRSKRDGRNRVTISDGNLGNN